MIKTLFNRIWMRRQDAFLDYVCDHCAWNIRTFGSGRRTLGTIRHIRKELEEIEAAPTDTMEWIDVIALGISGYCRAGGQPLNLLRDLKAKLAECKTRVYPFPASEDEPSEHIRPTYGLPKPGISPMIHAYLYGEYAGPGVPGEIMDYYHGKDGD
jgi:hypothetical protein